MEVNIAELFAIFCTLEPWSFAWQIFWQIFKLLANLLASCINIFIYIHNIINLNCIYIYVYTYLCVCCAFSYMFLMCVYVMFLPWFHSIEPKGCTVMTDHRKGTNRGGYMSP